MIEENQELQNSRTAYDLKEARAELREFPDEELKRIRVVPTGARLEQGTTYFDLKHPQRGEFTAEGNMVAGREAWYISKKDVPYPLWNRLIRIHNPARLDEPPGRP